MQRSDSYVATDQHGPEPKLQETLSQETKTEKKKKEEEKKQIIEMNRSRRV